MDWSDKVVLVTGGTGSFGKKFVEIMLAEFKPAKLIIFSRDELKQHEMRQAGFDAPNLRYFIGDVRDQQRLQRAMHGVDIVEIRKSGAQAGARLRIQPHGSDQDQHSGQ
jgi:UDP-N-acetylglucosamine 4,6-dehydratase